MGVLRVLRVVVFFFSLSGEIKIYFLYILYLSRRLLFFFSTPLLFVHE